MKIVNKKTNIYCIGDCLTEGIGATEDRNYPYFLQKILRNKYHVVNMGRTMIKMDALIKYPDLFMPENSGIACIWCGTNDLYFQENPNIVLENLNTYCKLLQNKDVQPLIITILPRSNKTPKNFEDLRLRFNQLVRDAYKHVADVAENERIGFEGSEMYMQYYCTKDNTHLNNLGYALVGKIVAKAIKNMRIK